MKSSKTAPRLLKKPGKPKSRPRIFANDQGPAAMPGLFHYSFAMKMPQGPQSLSTN